MTMLHLKFQNVFHRFAFFIIIMSWFNTGTLPVFKSHFYQIKLIVYKTKGGKSLLFNKITCHKCPIDLSKFEMMRKKCCLAFLLPRVR